VSSSYVWFLLLACNPLSPEGSKNISPEYTCPPVPCQLIHSFRNGRSFGSLVHLQLSVVKIAAPHRTAPHSVRLSNAAEFPRTHGRLHLAIIPERSGAAGPPRHRGRGRAHGAALPPGQSGGGGDGAPVCVALAQRAPSTGRAAEVQIAGVVQVDVRDALRVAVGVALRRGEVAADARARPPRFCKC
jgi:hypothetical protein